jgi:hypothetical protein
VRLLLLAFALLAVFAACATATTCNCGPTPSIEEAYDLASDVVLARVESVDGPYVENTDVWPGRVVEPHFTMRVLARWKGRTGSTALVRTALDPAECGFPFVVGETFLLYAHRPGPGDTLRAVACDRSRRAAEARDEMRRLDRLHRRTGLVPASFAIPSRCPVHPAIPLRQTGTTLVYRLPSVAERSFRRLRMFPYAALQFDHTPECECELIAADQVPAVTCALCRARARAWCLAHGASCPPAPDEFSGMMPWFPRWEGFEARRTARTGPARLPAGGRGFLYDDGRRLRYDSLSGALTRHVEGYGDATVQLRLDEEESAQIFDAIAGSGFFAFSREVGEEEARGVTSGHGPCGLVQFCAASDSLNGCQWWGTNDGWPRLPPHARFARVLEEIRARLESSPEYKALPPLPPGL